MPEPARQRCPDCGTDNQLPDEALRYGAWRCFRCHSVHRLPGHPPAEAPHERPVPDAFEPVQVGPSYLPSEHNTPEALDRAKRDGARITCLMLLLLAGLVVTGGGLLLLLSPLLLWLAPG